MQQALQTLNELAVYIPFDDALYAPVLSVALLLVKKIGKIDSGKVMAWLTIAGAGIAGVAVYASTHFGDNPQVAAVSAIWIGLASQPFYKLVLRPLCNAIGRVWSAEVAKAAAFNNEVKSAAVPATGLPTSSPAVENFAE